MPQQPTAQQQNALLHVPSARMLVQVRAYQGWRTYRYGSWEIQFGVRQQTGYNNYDLKGRGTNTTNERTTAGYSYMQQDPSHLQEIIDDYQRIVRGELLGTACNVPWYSHWWMLHESGLIERGHRHGSVLAPKPLWDAVVRDMQLLASGAKLMSLPADDFVVREWSDAQQQQDLSQTLLQPRTQTI